MDIHPPSHDEYHRSLCHSATPMKSETHWKIILFIILLLYYITMFQIHIYKCKIYQKYYWFCNQILFYSNSIIHYIIILCILLLFYYISIYVSNSHLEMYNISKILLVLQYRYQITTFRVIMQRFVECHWVHQTATPPFYNTHTSSTISPWKLHQIAPFNLWIVQQNVHYNLTED